MCVTCPIAFFALCNYHITSHPARQPPSSWFIRRFDSAWLCCQQLSGGKILCFLLPKQEPAFCQQQGSLEDAPRPAPRPLIFSSPVAERVNAFSFAAPLGSLWVLREAALGCGNFSRAAEPQPEKQAAKQVMRLKTEGCGEARRAPLRAPPSSCQ